ncbi:MAG: hypothetical protein KDD82_04780 [Planctomycetes bacterium]|nr:hypothetical protein [Planctomycetota bacterium]
MAQPTPWNRAGGEDPDGCLHSIGVDGAWRIAGLDGVVSFPRTGLALRRADLGREFSPDEATRLRALLRDAASRGDPVVDRYATAAAVYRSLGAGLSTAEVGDLYLRAAWAARGMVAIPGAESFRPQSVADGFARLKELERQFDTEQTRLHGVDRILEALAHARRDLDRLRPSDPAGRLAAEELRYALFAVEQEALRLKAELPPEVQGPAPAERFVLLAWAAQRMGDRQARDRWLRRVSGDPGERLKPKLEQLEQAFALEEALLAEAGALYAQALQEPLPPAEEARVACLLGETLRRRGQDGAPAYARAQRVAPESPGGQRASQLLAAKR